MSFLLSDGKQLLKFHLLLLLIPFLSVSATYCKKTKPAPPPPPAVEVTEVLQKDVPIQREWVGTTDGLVNAIIRPQVTGYLIRQNYREGDEVKKGQVLFEIDPRPFEAALDQAKGSLAQAQAQYQNAKANLNRVKPLVARNALSKKDLDDATASVRTTQAQVIAAQAAVKTADLNLGFTRIISPIEGIAGIAQAQVGNLVGPAQTGQLTTVSTVDPIKVLFTVPERDYIDFIKNETSDRSRLEQPAKFQIEMILSDGSVFPYRGKFFAADRQMDPRTGSLLVEALFPNPRFLIRPGQFAKVRVTVGIKKGALLIPQKAVSELQGRFQVAVVGADNKVAIRNVTPGVRIGELWEVDQGLKPGERVVVEGTQKVKPGITVAPRQYSAAGGSAGTGTTPL